MRRITRIYHICLIFLFFISGCSDEQEIKIENQKSKIMNKTIVSKTLHSEYGDTRKLIRQAMLEIDEKISVVEEVKVLEETNTKGMYIFSGYQIQSNLNIDKGIDDAKLKLSVKEVANVLSKTTQYHFPVKLKDNEAPIITLKEESIIIKESDMIDFYSYISSVSDNLDYEVSISEIENPILIENGKMKLGDYEIHYKAKDNHENVADKSLKVKVIQDHEEPVLANLEMNNMNQLALSLIGKPYLWGGKGPDAFDCSGIILYIYQNLGFNLSWAQIQYGLGTSISLDSSSWRVGDVLSFSDNSGEIIHHAMYLGNGMALHALVDGVKVVSVTTQLESGPGNPQRLVRVCRYK